MHMTANFSRIGLLDKCVMGGWLRTRGIMAVITYPRSN